uniref:Uncharacterized protein n=1 Tax=Fagus sylvatica TaxID=28930 RepID=A0A2N9FJK5_FAGSY
MSPLLKSQQWTGIPNRKSQYKSLTHTILADSFTDDSQSKSQDIASASSALLLPHLISPLPAPPSKH